MRRILAGMAVLMLGAVAPGGVERRGTGVEFSLTAPDAGSVMVTGSWNGWLYDGTAPAEVLEPLQLRRDEQGVWRVRIDPFPREEHSYKFIVDGEWTLDPENHMTIPNEFEELNSVVPAPEPLPEVWPPLPTGAAGVRVVVADALRGVPAGRCLVVLEREGVRHVTTTTPEGVLELGGIAAGTYLARVYRTAYEVAEPVEVVAGTGAVAQAAVRLEPAKGREISVYYWAYSSRRRLAQGPITSVEVIGEFNRWGAGGSMALTDDDGDGLYTGRTVLAEDVVESDYLFLVRWTDDEGTEHVGAGSDPDSDFATAESAADSHFRRWLRDRPVVSIQQVTIEGSSAEVQAVVITPGAARMEVTVNGATHVPKAQPVAHHPGRFTFKVSDLPEGESSILLRATDEAGKAGSDGTAVWRAPAPPADPEAHARRWTDAETPSGVAGPPPWLGDAVIYHVFVRRFADSDGDGIGDFRGLESRLGHIRSLGFNTIKMMPIFDGPSGHGYTPASLWRVEQEYGTDQDFRSMVDAAHRLGLRVILDYNDTATFTSHPLMGPAVRDPDHPLRDWIYWLTPTRYQSYTLTSDVTNSGWPQLNYHNPQVREHMTAMLAHWASYGVDGFRFDSADRLQPPPNWDWWRIVRRELKRLNPDLMLMGEIYDTGDPRWFDDRLDMAYDMAFNNALREAAAGTSPATRLATVLADSRVIDPSGTRFLRFLGNHDMERSRTMVVGSIDRLRVAYAALFTLPGVPALWYGDEFGMEGRGVHGPNENREPMPWDTGDADLAAWVRSVAQLRAGDATLRNGGTCVVLDSPEPERVLVVERRSRAVPRTRDYRLLFHFQPSEDADATAPDAATGKLDGIWSQALATGGAKFEGDVWTLPPNSALILVREPHPPTWTGRRR